MIAEMLGAFEPLGPGVSEADIGFNQVTDIRHNEENVTSKESQGDKENVSTEIICDDGDPCTIDSYNGASCTYMPRNCDDANDSTLDSCQAGACINLPSVLQRRR